MIYTQSYITFALNQITIMKNILIVVSIAALFSSCADSSKQTETIEESSITVETIDVSQYISNFKKLPSVSENLENKKSKAKIDLGHELFFDTRLSLKGNNSCNSCHNLTTYGVDNKATSLGDAGENGGRNSPTVLNASLHSSQFWDGRAKDVEEQAGMPILNPVEMAIPNEQFLVDRLKEIPSYVERFNAAFPDAEEPITYQNLRKAIGVFERELLTPSRFDLFLGGDENALTENEKKGFQTFNTVGCTSCHSGVALGGNMLMKFGLFEDYAPLTKSEKIDYGKFESTGIESDKFIFKVPSLRNIEKTFPYFHDGSVDKLEDAIQIMAKTQLGKILSKEEVKEINAFLTTLTGELPSKYKEAPKK